MSDDVLARFHRALVGAIRERRPDYLDGPFTVAEIYQNLVPYRTHREEIGVEMNGDYEDALLRLLAGEGEYLLLDSEHALRDLRAELESPNPNTGLYREFAAVDVRLNPERLAPREEGGAPGTAAEARPLEVEAGGRDDEPEGAPPEPSGGDEPLEVADLAPDASGAAADAGVAEALEEAARDDGTSCRWCRAPLPEREHLNFCPFCGTDVRLVPCPSCGEELEPEWRFCIACGTEVAGT